MYVDSSALVKLYVVEPESEEVQRLLDEAGLAATVRVTLVEVRRNLARRLAARDLAAARSELEADWALLEIVEVDAALCERAAEIAEATGVRSLDAIHVSAAERVGASLLTYDVRQAEAARELGLTVVGA